MTRWKMYGRACAFGASRMSASGGSVKQMGRMKKMPKNPPTGTLLAAKFFPVSKQSTTNDTTKTTTTSEIESRRCQGGKESQLIHTHQRLIACGTFIAGSCTSSAILEIMPMAENVYAAGNKPIKNVNPPQPANDVS